MSSHRGVAMTVTGEPPQDDDAITDDSWPDEGGQLPPPPEVTDPQFDDEGSGDEPQD